jgi:hypothetical protein
VADLFASNYIHVTDQYMPITHTSGRYRSTGSAAQITGGQPHVLHDSDVHNLIMLAINGFNPNGGGGGYNQMYSFFLPQGQDLCFDNSTSCYCPDNNCNGGTFAFCAYHGSFDAVDKNGVTIHVIYQALPYDNVPGCNVTNGPNGALIDSTNNVFSHEIFETITDPDLNAWWRSSDGQEIGDICNFNEQNPITLNGNKYSIQKEYSNAVHTCAAAPLGLVNLSHDFNRDGTSDILWVNATTGQAVNWLVNGTGVTGGGSPGSAPPPWAIVGQRDFNGDGFTDVLWRNGMTGQLVVWLLNGSSVIGGGSPGGATSPWQVAGTGDFNGDGLGDLLWWNSSTGQAVIWFLNGGSVIGGGSPGSAGSPWMPVFTGDFNGDGNSDVLWWNSTSGQLVIWFLNGTSVIERGGSPGSAAPPWQPVGTGDFNGDGFADILWLNTSTGQAVVWLMNGASVIGGGSPGVAGSPWTITQTGDFNSDNKSDLLWYNTVTGQVVAWYMNSASVVGSTSFGSVPSPWVAQGLNSD